MDFQGKRVLVAGGTGLIGIPLVELLVSKGAEVYIVSKDDRSRAHPKALFNKLDLLDYRNCVWACRAMDYVFNLLCVKGSPATVKARPATLFELNLLMDINLLRAARENGVKGYLFASSLGIYPPAEVFYEDDARKNLPSENDLFAGLAKLAGEMQTEAYRVEYGLRTSIVRPANTYGPWDDFWSEGAMVIPSLIKRICDGEDPLLLSGDGLQIRDFIYSRDVASGMLFVAENEIYEPVNIGSGLGVKICDLVDVIAKCSGLKPGMVWDVTKPSGDRKRVLDTNRIKSYGFEPKVSFEEGIRETIEWYKNNKDKPNTRFNFFR